MSPTWYNKITAERLSRLTYDVVREARRSSHPEKPRPPPPLDFYVGLSAVVYCPIERSLSSYYNALNADLTEVL